VDTSVGEVEARSQYDKRSDDTPDQADRQPLPALYCHLRAYLAQYRADVTAIARVATLLKVERVNGNVTAPVGLIERVSQDAATRRLERSVWGVASDLIRQKQRANTSLPA
jgi:hypothetical protein